MKRSRWSMRAAFLAAGVAALGACSDAAPTAPAAQSALTGETPPPEPGSLKVCKRAITPGTLAGLTFGFDVTIAGVTTRYALADGECAVVWQAASLTTPAVNVTVTEVALPPFTAFEIAAWFYSEDPATNYYIYSHQPPTATLTVSGKRSGLIKFFNIKLDEPPRGGPGSGTPGYWKNHPEAWPVTSIVIGGRTYSRSSAITIMKRSIKGDKTLNMFEQLVSAKLNVLIGNPSACIDATIAAADAWMAAHPAGSKVAASSTAWVEGGPLHTTLDLYNNGAMCAVHRE